MCTGRTHALSGACAGLTAGLLLRDPLAADVALSGFTAGMALLPDLDQCGGSASRCLGLVTESLAWLIGRLSGGHRHFTHGIPGVAAFVFVAWLGVTFRHDLAGKILLGLLVAIAASSALEALRLADGHLADVLGIGVAAGVVWYGYGLGLILLATGLGCAIHLVGDSCTDSGVMWLYPLSKFRWHFLPEPLAWTTGSKPERRIVFPLLLGALALLSWVTVTHARIGL